MNGLCELLETFRVRGDRTALIYRSGVRRFTCSYAELYLLAGKMAAFLEAAGVSPGDRVLLWGPNHPSWAVSFWGIVARGAVAVPVDFMSGQERAQSIASLSGAVFAIQSRVKTERLAGLQTAVMEDLELLLKGYEPRGTMAKGAADDLCELVYTSGTTGAPKGVALSHKNLISNVLQVSAQFPSVSADYRFLSLLPLSHMFEQTAGFLTPLYLGGSIIYLRTLKPSAIMNAFAEEDVYAMIAVPRLLQLLKRIDGARTGGEGVVRPVYPPLFLLGKPPCRCQEKALLPRPTQIRQKLQDVRLRRGAAVTGHLPLLERCRVHGGRGVRTE